LKAEYKELHSTWFRNAVLCSRTPVSGMGR